MTLSLLSEVLIFIGALCFAPAVYVAIVRYRQRITRDKWLRRVIES